MSKLMEFRKHLKPGQVYRRADLEAWSNAVDRHLNLLTKDGTLQKLSPGLYHYPKESVFGILPPNDEALVRSFLKDDHFLLTSPNDYNKLGVGTTQLYNKRVVYNHKRHGEFTLGGRLFTFFAKHRFPNKLSEEFLLVDLLNNLNRVAEDREVLLKNIAAKVRTMNLKRLRKSVNDYGSVKAKTILKPVFQQLEGQHAK